MNTFDKEVVDFNSLPEILTVGDLQSILRLSRAKCYTLVHQEDFPKVTIGRCIRIPKKGLIAWLETQSTGCNNEAV